MRLNQSQFFNQNINVTFSYNDPSKQNKQNNPLFQSLIYYNKNDSRGPLAEVTKQSNPFNFIRPKRVLAQSMYQQFLDNPLRKSFYQQQNSVEIHQFTGLAKLSHLKPKQILQEVNETSIQDFQVGQLLGKGALGNVYVCRHKETGFFFALKKIKKKSVQDVNQFVRSIKIHMYLSQPNIVKLYSVFDDSEHIYLLMELCFDGNLRSESKKFKSAKQIKKFILGIAYGLRHLHKRNIRHGDIKLQNIICSYGMAKISDFDCISFEKCRRGSMRIQRCSMPGSPLYFSPEMLRESILGLNDDVWSLGIICYEILCGYFPFDISSPSELSNIFEKEIRQFPSGTDQFLQSLIRKMLSKRNIERPSLSQIIKQLERD